MSRTGEDSAARRQWREDSRNWNLGLVDEVAWKGPRDPVTISTTRELLTADLRAECVRDAPVSSPVYYRTSVEEPSGTVAVFVWPEFSAAASGHRRVRAAVAAASGDLGRLWTGVEKDRSLLDACVLFRQRRQTCVPPSDSVL